MTIFFPLGRIRFSHSAMKIFNLDLDKDALMFFLGVNKVKIKIEEIQNDNYYLSESGTFTNISLAKQIAEVFEVNTEDTQRFEFKKEGEHFIIEK